MAEKYFTITETGLVTLSSQIFSKVDGKIANAIKGVSPEIEFIPVVGSIDDVADPQAGKIYLQRDTEEDTTSTMYVYTADGWQGVGSSEVNMDGYWSKDDVTELRNSVLNSTDGAEAVRTLVNYDSLLKNDQDSIDIIADAIMNKMDDIYVRQDNVNVLDAVDIINAVAEANGDLNQPPVTEPVDPPEETGEEGEN